MSLIFTIFTKQFLKKMDLEDMSSDESSEGSLKDFIVKDDENEDEIDCDDESISTSEDDDEVEDDSDDESTEEEESVDEIEPVVKKPRLVKESKDDIQVLAEEAKAFAAEIKGTQIGTRVLRSRDPASMEARKAKDLYYERFGKAEEASLMEKFKKKDIIDFLKTLESEWRTKYEAAGHVWPSPNMRQSLESIEAVYYPLKEFAGLPDSDDENDDEDEINSDDEDESD